MNKEEMIKEYIPSNLKVEEKNNLLMFETPSEEIEKVCVDFRNARKLQLVTIAATDEREKNGSFRIYYVFGIPGKKFFLVPYIILKDKAEFPSLVVKIHGVSWYEREIMTFFGLIPTGHYFSKKVMLHENWPSGQFPLRKDFQWNSRLPFAKEEPYKFRKIEGEGLYEIPVGPVHAGIIEPGHFRFTVAGEEIILLEPLLGYKHKGSEKLFEVLSMDKKIALSERISGDSSFNHSLAFCQALESLSDIKVPEKAAYLRVIYAELERLANHFNDIGFIMLDTGFNFGGANGARLREMIMQWNDKLTGNRFLRGVNDIGGVNRDISRQSADELKKDLEKIEADYGKVMNICFDSNSLLNRLKETGTIDKQIAMDHDLCGIPARAIGMEIDARKDYPYAAYDKFEIEIPIEETGDVFSRFMVRVREVYSSMEILKKALYVLPEGEIKSKSSIRLKSDSFAVSLVEGWRGGIAYFVATDGNGSVSRVHARDASFLNWAAFPHAVKGNVVPDFPLINKSFNLSYSGYDR